MSGRDDALPESYPIREAEEFHVAITQDVKQTLYGHLRPEYADREPEGSEYQPDRYEQGVIATLTRSTGDSRVTYIVEDVIPPETDDDVHIRDGSLKLSPAYRARAKDTIEHDPRKGIAYFHSHPGWSAYPSKPDLEADPMRLESDAEFLGADRPFGAGIIASRPRRETVEPEWSFRAYDFTAGTPPQRTEATAIRVLGASPIERVRDGPYLEKLSTAFSAQGPAGPGLGTGTVAHDSTLELWGERGQARLSGIRVAVVGCGGVGSLLAEQVARLGVGGAVFVDFDHLKEANLNRAYGASPEDARSNVRKAELARDIAEKAATAPGFQARAVHGSVVERGNDDYSALGALLDCDVILNAADPHWVQKVIDRLAYAHLIPVISGGTHLRVNEETDELASGARSTVETAGPGLACLHCLEAWKQGDRSSGVVRDRQPPRDRADNGGLYVQREPGEADDGSDELRDPSVVTTNGMVASLMMERFHALIVGTSTSTFAGRQIYRPSTGEMKWLTTDGNRRTRCKDDCEKARTVGLGDYVDLDTGEDPDLRVENPDAR
ncbi:ThiF family adenylyltransferase [Halopiger xanaduensis]|uniref:UBA/THIF-type NAD/FAD binding protein n=1 Tax=Halopiger xanaduensis (strain DSM 18323 / JCM 14033 / SH-6) TaxID=797210 RepID=F8DEJ7_HALXS|nr:ThiF family adenylyltransferase [Halopiger xanaduensis]AEH39284.1 UBA/THIF-type NAD/FAD binding protein [Halopiger xanaduensis SH-6]